MPSQLRATLRRACSHIPRRVSAHTPPNAGVQQRGRRERAQRASSPRLLQRAGSALASATEGDDDLEVAT
jgi:hypothetical protein